ncbi:MAG: hypothetical protein AVDCRST_MAG91-2643, partial [uncultured Sphingomonadaceae bacterium]
DCCRKRKVLDLGCPSGPEVQAPAALHSRLSGLACGGSRAARRAQPVGREQALRDRDRRHRDMATGARDSGPGRVRSSFRPRPTGRV